MMTASDFVPWALLAGSSTGSTWVNNVLSSHPCVASVGEILMRNQTAAKLFHAGVDGVSTVLEDVANQNRQQLQQRPNASQCDTVAGGVKLKLGERDIEFSPNGGNALEVAEALKRLGYRVIVLQRNNHLDNVIGRLSRRRTGVLHCKGSATAGSSGCDPARLNTSLRLNCQKTISTINTLRLRKRASEMLFGSAELANERAGRRARAGRVLVMEYETLIGTPSLWTAALKLLGLPATSSCLLRDDYRKRIVQTQRELIVNYVALARCFERDGQQYAQHLAPDRRPKSGVIPRDSRELCPRGQGTYSTSSAARVAQRARKEVPGHV
jgi:hypothetical protein